MNNFSKFIVKLQAVKDSNEKQVVEHVKKVCYTILKGVTEKTPVFTGRAKSNWHIANTPTMATNIKYGGLPRKPHPSPSTITDEVLTESKQFFNSIKDLDSIPNIIYITNNVIYINILEFGGGNRPGNFMVTRTLQALNSGNLLSFSSKVSEREE